MNTPNENELFKNFNKGSPVPIEEPDEEEAPVSMTELDMLKNRARLMGITFSNNIGLDALKTRIKTKLTEDAQAEPAEVEEQAVELVPQKSSRQTMIDEAMRLVRVRITNMDPKKKDLNGEIFCVANRVIGTVKKFIPYGAATDNGYHLPYVLYQQLREREFLNIKTRKDNRGRTIVETGMAREFALEILPQLTQKELDKLAASQAAAGGMEN